jgi:hypothetical protein
LNLAQRFSAGTTAFSLAGFSRRKTARAKHQLKIQSSLTATWIWWRLIPWLESHG